MIESPAGYEVEVVHAAMAVASSEDDGGVTFAGIDESAMGFFMRPTEGARILAWTCEGETLEATTNADGKAWFDFTSEHTCWNLTVADALLDAVSVLGIRGELGAPVIQNRFLPIRFDVDHPGTIEGRIEGVGPGSRVRFFGRGVLEAVEPSEFEEGDFSLRYAPEASGPLLELLAVEYEGGAPVNTATVQIETNGGSTSGVVVSFPARPATRELELTVLMPTTGAFVPEEVEPHFWLSTMWSVESRDVDGILPELVDASPGSLVFRQGHVDAPEFQEPYVAFTLGSDEKFLHGQVRMDAETFEMRAVDALTATWGGAGELDVQVGDELHYGIVYAGGHRIYGHAPGRLALDALPPLPSGVDAPSDVSALLLTAYGGSSAPPWSRFRREHYLSHGDVGTWFYARRFMRDAP